MIHQICQTFPLYGSTIYSVENYTSGTYVHNHDGPSVIDHGSRPNGTKHAIVQSSEQHTLHFNV